MEQLRGQSGRAYSILNIWCYAHALCRHFHLRITHLVSSVLSGDEMVNENQITVIVQNVYYLTH